MNALIRTHAALLITGLASFVLMGAGQALYGPALPTFARNLSLTLAEAGWLISAHWVGCMLGVAAMFRFSTAITPRIALLLMAAGAALIASSPGWWGTLAGAMIFGAGYGSCTVVFNPRVLVAFGDKGPSMLSLLNAVFSLGAIASPLVFVALGSSPTLMFGIVAAGCTLVALFAGASGKPQVVAQAMAQPYRFHWPILAFGVAAIGTEACLIGLGPTALIQAGATEAEAAQLLSLFFVAFLTARVVLVVMAHYFQSFTLYTLAVASAALLSLAGALINPAVAFVLLGISAGMFFPGFYVTASRKMGTNPRVPPTIIAAGLVGGILSPVLMTTAIEAFGQHSYFWIIACFTGVTALLALAAMRSMNR